MDWVKHILGTNAFKKSTVSYLTNNFSLLAELAKLTANVFYLWTSNSLSYKANSITPLLPRHLDSMLS